uniref:Reverse transcriptase domain-containing protein n=1 Tax=Tanacetum cinerariifolium TaxID=118510 RepID=A0A699J9M0_TANCI|nr:reverse transcriptase domain-containing protein [Tanacetum cinerariifolium]
MTNQIRPPGFPSIPNNQNVQLNQRNNQNRFNQNQNRGNNFNHGPVYQPSVFQPPAYQAPAYQAPAPQTQSVLKEDFSAYIKANDAFVNSNNISTSSSGTLPSNTIANPRSELKAITTRSGVSYDGPQVPPPPSFLPKVVKNEPEAAKDTVHPTNNGSTELLPRGLTKDHQLCIHPYCKIRSSVTKLTTNVVLLKKFPEKLGGPDKFLIPCDFPEKAESLALADLGASINLMPLSVWNKLSLPNLSPTCMTLELADRSISRPVGVAEDVYVKVGTLHFPTDFVVIDFDADPRVPLILGRSFLKTGRALIDVFERNYLPEVRKELKICEAKSDKPSIDEPPEVELKDLPPHLEYAFLEGDDKLPVIILKDLTVEKKAALIVVLKSHKRAIAWKLSNIKGIDPEFYTHKILMEEDFELAVQHQRRVNLKIYDVIKQEVLKFLDAGLIYPISDSPWVGPIHCVPKKDGFTVVENEDNELIPNHLVTGWRVCIDYRKLNEATRKDHFPLSFMDQMLERLAGNQYYCFLDSFFGYFQILINPKDQEKTTFTCPYGTFAYSHIPFGLCNAPGAFQRCMMAIFHDMIEKTMEVFMDDFSVFGNSFQRCLSYLEKMLKRCEDTNLCLNWEKSHFMVKEGIVLGHKISKQGIEVYKAKVDFITKLPHPTTFKGIRSFLSHAGFYRRFIKDFSKIARPMTCFLEKYTRFHFSKECVEAFQTLKRKLTEASILIAPDWDMPFELMCDASDFAIGAVLGQRQKKHFRLIHYASKTMTEA